MSESKPLVTVAVPSYNQGQFLAAALDSILSQNVPVEIFVADGGSKDNSVDVIKSYESKLAGWRSHKDDGQSAAINEAVARGTAPYVCWINSDDMFLPGGLATLVAALDKAPADCPAVYGRAVNLIDRTGQTNPVWVEPFSRKRLAFRCIISQPATLMRRSAWEAVGGTDSAMHMAMDYDLWWRLYNTVGPLQFVDKEVAVNRVHSATKTKNFRARHYREAIALIRRHNGSVPLKWWLAQPYAVWFKSLIKHLD